jgi:hypothetical protein
VGVAELDQIGAEGAQLDQAAGQAGPVNLDASPAAPAGPSEADKIAMWAAIPATFGSILALGMPELANVYSPAACEQWGKAMLPVAKKRGWDNLEDLPEISLCLVSLPFAVATVMAVKRRKAAPGAPGEVKSATDPKAPPAPSGPSVNAGVV